MSNLLKYISCITLLLLLVLPGCGKTASQDKLLEPANEPTSDSTCNWLETHSHFHEENYYHVFNAYYEEQITKKNYRAAAAAFTAVVDKEIYYLSFDTNFRTRLESFDTLYAHQLPWHKTLFIDEHTGNILMDQSEFRKAITCFRKALAHKPFDYYTYLDIANLYSDIAFCYAAIGEQEEALRNNHQALAYFDKIGSLTGKGGIYDNIALVHMFTKNYPEAEVYFDKAIKCYQEAGNTVNIFTTLHNRILLYQETGHPDLYKLIGFSYRSYEDSGIKDPSFKVALATLYVDKLLHENKTEEAKAVLQEIKALLYELPSSTAQDDYNIALAQYEIKTGTGIKNIALIENALNAVEESEHFQNQLAFCKVLKENALLNGDYKKALLYSEKEKTAMNKLANREMIVKTLELNKKHQMEKKEQHIALQAKTILNKNIAIALLLTALATFVLIAVVILSRQKQKKIRMEGKRAILYTRQLLEKTEEERKRIAGDLHDSVSHELLNLKNTISANDEDTSAKIDTIINDIRIISRNLHPVMFEKVGLTASIEQLVERAQSIHNLMVTADIKYDAFLSVSDELQVYRIIQEALSNTIKYAEAFAARIILHAQQDVLHIEIKDNGKGFDVAEKISGTTAFGLHNIIERSKALGGFAKIQSDKNGTVIMIEIKKKNENTDS